MDSPHDPQFAHRFIGTTFAGQDVPIDGVKFEKVFFGNGTRLLFDGHSLPELLDCHAEGQVNLILCRHAEVTARLFSMFYHRTNEFGREMVERFIDDLRRGAFEPDAGRGGEAD